jgi:hypothetical protein
MSKKQEQEQAYIPPPDIVLSFGQLHAVSYLWVTNDRLNNPDKDYPTSFEDEILGMAIWFWAALGGEAYISVGGDE